MPPETVGSSAADFAAGAASYGLDLGKLGFGNMLARGNAKQAYERQKNLLLYGPSLQVRGLKLAGLNPILAATTGGKLGGAAASPPMANVPASGSNSAFDAMVKRQQLGLIAAQGQQSAANARNLDAQARLGNQRADYLEDHPEALEAIITKEGTQPLNQAIGGKMLDWNKELEDLTKTFRDLWGNPKDWAPKTMSEFIERVSAIAARSYGIRIDDKEKK